MWPAKARTQVNSSRATPLEDWWSGGRPPLLVMRGKEDRMAPPANGHALRDAYPDRVHLIDVPDADHLLTLVQPEAPVDAIVAFTRSGRVPAASD